MRGQHKADLWMDLRAPAKGGKATESWIMNFTGGSHLRATDWRKRRLACYIPGAGAFRGEGPAVRARSLRRLPLTFHLVRVGRRHEGVKAAPSLLSARGHWKEKESKEEKKGENTRCT